MTPRMAAFTRVLRCELVRVGRPTAEVTVGADEHTVTMADAEGSWHGPAPHAFGVLVSCATDEGRSGGFWERLDREHPSA